MEKFIIFGALFHVLGHICSFRILSVFFLKLFFGFSLFLFLVFVGLIDGEVILILLLVCCVLLLLYKFTVLLDSVLL